MRDNRFMVKSTSYLDLNIKRLQEAKKKREEIGGDHLHSHQIQQLPGKFNKESHGIHSKPCYKL